MSIASTVHQWLHEHLSTDSATEVRLLGDDRMPTDLGIGMEEYILDGDWVWIAEKGGCANGFLAAAPCHGIVMVLRLVVRPRAPFDTLPLLLRQFVRDSKMRGFIGFFTLINPDRPAERDLMKALELLGAAKIEERQLTMAINFDKVLRY